MITTHFVYNIKEPESIQRKIPLGKLKGVTHNYPEFNQLVLHVEDEYDYLYKIEASEKNGLAESADDKFQKILRFLQ